MNFTPQQVEAMSLYQFTAAFEGVVLSKNPDLPPEAPSPAEYYAAVDKLGLH